MEKDILSLSFMGDVMIGRSVNAAISQTSYEYPWGNVLPTLEAMDVNVINLETTFTRSNRKVPKVFNFKADPDKIKSLLAANIHLASIANNHILDYSIEGLIETIKILQESGIRYTGAGIDIREAEKPAMIIKKNIKVAMVACTDNEPGWKANSHPGINYINIGRKNDEKRMNELIRRTKENADILIVSVHGGPNMAEKPSEQEINFARDMIDNGADIIHGHSAHIFQGIEIYKNKLIMYDAGDFIDDYVIDPVLRNDRSFLFICEVSRQSIHNIKLIPVFISNRQVNLAPPNYSNWAIARMQELSLEFGTIIRDNGEVVLTHVLQ